MAQNLRITLVLKFLLLTVTIIIYILIGFHIVSIYPKQKTSGINRHINQLTPPFTYLIELSLNDQQADPHQINRFLGYYGYIQEHHFKDIEIGEILAFCYYFLNENDKSTKLYQQSIKDDPSFFWSYYNLGICYLNQKNTNGAIVAFEAGLQIPIEPTILHLLNSRVYLQYVGSNKMSAVDVLKNLKIGYQKASIYIEALKEYNSIQDQNAKNQFLGHITENAHPVLF